MIIDLSSPIELRGYEMLHDDAGAARAYIDLFNVSIDTVSGYTATVRWARDESSEKVNDYVSVDQIAIPGGGLFRLVLSCKTIKYADRLEMYISRVTFTDGSVWEPKDGDLVDVGEFVPLQGEELDRLKSIAGDDAYAYPETQDRFWRCVCGRINPLESEKCVRCLRERNYVLSELNRKAIGMDEDEKQERKKRVSRAKRENARSEEAKKRAFVYTVLLAAAAVSFAALAILVTFL